IDDHQGKAPSRMVLNRFRQFSETLRGRGPCAYFDFYDYRVLRPISHDVWMKIGQERRKVLPRGLQKYSVSTHLVIVSNLLHFPPIYGLHSVIHSSCSCGGASAICTSTNSSPYSKPSMSTGEARLRSKVPPSCLLRPIT